MYLYEFGHVTKIGADGHLAAIGAKREGNGIGGIVRNGERVHVDIANRKTLTRLDGFSPLQPLPESVRQDALQRVHGQPGNVERRLPEPEDLRQAVAVVGVFVGDQNRVETVDFFADSGKAGKSFALSKAGVNEDAGAVGFDQREIARTSGRKNGDAQADWSSPENDTPAKLFK